MNKDAESAYQHYRELVIHWGNGVNQDAYLKGCQLIQWIEDKKTHSDIQTRQEVKATNWEALLSGFPTEAIQGEVKRRMMFMKSRQMGYKEMTKTTDISSDCPICPGCGRSMTIEKIRSGRVDLWGCTCECIIGNEIAVPYQATREEVIKAQNEAILKYLGNNQK